MQSIADRITQIKTEFDMSNVELGKVAGVSKQAVGRWLNHGAVPASEALINLRERLGVSDVWILEGRGPMKVIPDDDFVREMRKQSKGLSDERKAQLLEMARLFAKSNSSPD